MSVHSTAVDWRGEWRGWAALAALFVALVYLPVGVPRFDSALSGALLLVRSYAREHVLLCLVPALFIAGAVATFLSDAAVMRYLGGGAASWAARARAYAVASTGGSVLAVCSCTVLPLFAGIRRRGAGLGPAVAFLYSGPAINVMAVSLTAGVLGWRLGLARAVGAVVFAVLLGVVMAWLYRREEAQPGAAAAAPGAPRTVVGTDGDERSLGANATLLGLMVGVLVLANWHGGAAGWTAAVEAWKWPATAAAAAVLAVLVVRWMKVAAWKVGLGVVLTAVAAWAMPATPQVPFAVACLALAVALASQGGEPSAWFESTWDFTRQIVPLLFAGVFVAGLALGSPGGEGLVPAAWVERAVGGEGLAPTFVASLAGALMYFATLTEVPIVQGLLASGMGQGPALALLLAGPALSLPNMLVVAGVLGWRKTLTYVSLVVLMSTAAGVLYGALAAS
jgi:hypothetical protein